MQVLESLARAGIVPGRDVSLVSCNNEIPLLSGLMPRPTTIDVKADPNGRGDEI